MIVVLLGPIVLCVVLWALIRACCTIPRAAQQARDAEAAAPGSRSDLPTTIVGLSACRLSGNRRDWADAMETELDCITGTMARWLFALGSVRVVIAEPPPEEEPALLQQTTIVVGAVAVVGIAIYAQVRLAADASTGGHGLLYTAVAAAFIVFVLAAQAGMAIRRARAADPAAKVSRRWGIAGGAVMGSCLLGAEIPSVSTSGLHIATVSFVVALTTPLVVGVLASRASHDRRAGRGAGAWAGAVGGFIFLVGFMTITLAATQWFTHDPGTIRAYQDSMSPAHFASYGAHYRSIAGFVISENNDTALIGGLLWFPLLATMAGRLGARFSSSALVGADSSR